METRHARYQRLIDTCKSLPPTPTAVAHPCDASSLEGAMEAARIGLIVPILVGPRERILAVAAASGIDLAGVEIVDARAQRGGRRGGGAAGARGQGRGADEGQPAHRRAHGRRGPARDRPAHRAARQPLLRDGRAGPRGGPDHHRRGGQHRPDAGGQGRHPAERDRSRARAGHAGSAGGDALGDGDGQPEGAVHHRGRGAVQDGGPRPGHRRARRRPAGAGQRHRSRSREDQEDRFAGGRPRQRAAGARPRGGQHARQEPDLPRRRGCRRHRPRRAGADHPDQPGRFADDPARLLRGRGAGRQGAPREPPRPWGDSHGRRRSWSSMPAPRASSSASSTSRATSCRCC